MLLQRSNKHYSDFEKSVEGQNMTGPIEVVLQEKRKIIWDRKTRKDIGENIISDKEVDFTISFHNCPSVPK
jgi:hypothetical protein